MLNSTLLVLHSIFSGLLIILVLMQKSRGADMIGTGGASQTFFGSQGAASFIVKLTRWVAFLFFMTSLALNVWPLRQSENTTALLAKAVSHTQASPNKTS